MAYREYRDPRMRLHRVVGPAIESDDRKEWWVDGRRHRDDGPAVVTQFGTKWFYWRGTLVPKDVILNPRSKTPMEIFKLENVEVRRSWMEAYGMEDFMEAMKPVVLHENKKTERLLVKLDFPPVVTRPGEEERPSDEPMVMVRVRNSTPEGKWKDGQPCIKCGQTGYIRHEESTETEEVQRTCPDCGGKGKTAMEFIPELKDGKPYYKYYFLRVPPDQTDADAAVAWTFGVESGGYAPKLET